MHQIELDSGLFEESLASFLKTKSSDYFAETFSLKASPPKGESGYCEPYETTDSFTVISELPSPAPTFSPHIQDCLEHVDETGSLFNSRLPSREFVLPSSEGSSQEKFVYDGASVKDSSEDTQNCDLMSIQDAEMKYPNDDFVELYPSSEFSAEPSTASEILEQPQQPEPDSQSLGNISEEPRSKLQKTKVIKKNETRRKPAKRVQKKKVPSGCPAKLRLKLENASPAKKLGNLNLLVDEIVKLFESGQGMHRSCTTPENKAKPKKVERPVRQTGLFKERAKAQTQKQPSIIDRVSYKKTYGDIHEKYKKMLADITWRKDIIENNRFTSDDPQQERKSLVNAIQSAKTRFLAELNHHIIKEKIIFFRRKIAKLLEKTMQAAQEVNQAENLRNLLNHAPNPSSASEAPELTQLFQFEVSSVISQFPMEDYKYTLEGDQIKLENLKAVKGRPAQSC